MLKKFDFKKLDIEIEVKDLNFVKTKPEIFSFAHQTNFFQLIYIQTGSAVFKIDFKDIELKAGDMIVLLPNQACEFDIHSSYSGKDILFTANFYSVSGNDAKFLHSAELLSLVNIARQVNINKDFADSIIKLILIETEKPLDRYKHNICQSLLRCLLFECERQIDKINKTFATNTVNDFLMLVEQNFKTDKSVDFYSKRLAISEKKLSNEIKNVVNVTPKQYINNRLLLEAKRLLRYSELSVKEIAWNLGFDDVANFSNWFKKYSLSSPLQFKENRQ